MQQKKSKYSVILAFFLTLLLSGTVSSGETDIQSGGKEAASAPAAASSGETGNKTADKAEENMFDPGIMVKQNRINIEKNADSIVLVDFYLKINDRGSYPRFRNWHYVDSLIADGLPHQQPAFALKKDLFVLQDAFINPEFLSRVEVKFKDKSYPTEITG